MRTLAAIGPRSTRPRAPRPRIRHRRRPRSPIPRWPLGAPRSPPAPRRRAKIPIASVLGSVQSRFAEVLARQRAGPPARSTLARPQQTSTDYPERIVIRREYSAGLVFGGRSTSPTPGNDRGRRVSPRSCHRRSIGPALALSGRRVVGPSRRSLCIPPGRVVLSTTACAAVSTPSLT